MPELKGALFLFSGSRLPNGAWRLRRSHYPIPNMNLSSDRHDTKVEYKSWDPPLPTDLCSVAPPDSKTGEATLATNNGWTTMQMQTAIAVSALAPTADSCSASAAGPLFHRIWPTAMIAFGLGLTATWACLLGYGLVKLIWLAI
jgi:hypothetical protein